MGKNKPGTGGGEGMSLAEPDVDHPEGVEDQPHPDECRHRVHQLQDRLQAGPHHPPHPRRTPRADPNGDDDDDDDDDDDFLEKKRNRSGLLLSPTIVLYSFPT